MMYDLIIHGGLIVTASKISSPDVWIGIKDEKIICLSSISPVPKEQALKVIDAQGAYITPGGIDSHVHLAQLQHPAGYDTGDSFESGTRSAVAGGTTTIIAFANQVRTQTSLYPVVEAYHHRSAGQCYIDYGFHLILTNVDEPKILDEELPRLFKDEGISSFKIYMTYVGRKMDDKSVLKILMTARKLGATTMIHAENDDMVQLVIDHLQERSLTLPYHHAIARTPIAEFEATNRAICLSDITASPILIVHVSSKTAMQCIKAAQTELKPIFAETCPQYLLLLADSMRRASSHGGCGCSHSSHDTHESSELPLKANIFTPLAEGQADDGEFEGAKLICSPPVRHDPQDLESVWKGVQNGTVTIFSSDHCPSVFDHKMGKKKGLKEDGSNDFTVIPNGLPGVETRLPLLMSYGVERERITVQKFVEITSSNPAKLYGLQNSKGDISPGMDADIVIWYPKRRMTGETLIKNEYLHHSVDYTPFENTPVTNWPRYTILRGSVVWDRDGKGVVGKKGQGQYLKRGPSAMGTGLKKEESFLESIDRKAGII